jgi:hypothetical protein
VTISSTQVQRGMQLWLPETPPLLVEVMFTWSRLVVRVVVESLFTPLLIRLVGLVNFLTWTALQMMVSLITNSLHC